MNLNVDQMKFYSHILNSSNVFGKWINPYFIFWKYLVHIHLFTIFLNMSIDREFFQTKLDIKYVEIRIEIVVMGWKMIALITILLLLVNSSKIQVLLVYNLEIFSKNRFWYIHLLFIQVFPWILSNLFVCYIRVKWKLA